MKKIYTYIFITAIIAIVFSYVTIVHGAIFQNLNSGGDQTVAPGATDFEAGEALWVNDTFVVRTRAGGTGTLRAMQLTTGTSTGIYVNASGNVGIGTTAPGYRLVVAGAATLEGGLNLGTGGGYNFASYTGTQFNVGGINDAVNSLALKTNSSTRLFITLTGNVGIGTTSPTSKLHVYGSSWTASTLTEAYNSPWFRIQTQGSASNSSVFVFNIGSNTEAIQGAYSTSGASALSFNPFGGNVGIATTTPSYKLDVVGTSQFSQPVIVGTPTANSHATTKSYVDSMFTGSGQWTTNGGNVYLTSTTQNVGIGTTNPIGKLHLTAGAGNNTIFRIGNNSTNDAYFYFNTNTDWTIGANYANSNAFTLSNNSVLGTNTRFLVTTSGNVGIGTSTPVYKLDVVGGGRFSSAVTFGDSNPTVLQSSRAATDGSQILLASNYSPTVGGIYSSANAYLASNARQTTGGADAWGKGSVGYSSNIITLGLSTANNGTAFQVQHSPANTANGTQANFFTSTLFTVRETGNVGIGTAGPQARLDVLTTTENKYVKFRADNGEERFNFYVGASGNSPILDMYQADGTTIGVRLYSAGDSYFTGGNVGIATTTPSYKLDVVGTGQFSQPVIVGTPTANSHATTKSYVDSMFTGSGQWTTSGGNVYLTSTTQNVGIGTTSPVTKLYVSDTNSLASSLTSALSTWQVASTRQGNVNAFGTVTASDTQSHRGVNAFLRARGTLASPTVVQENDYLGDLLFGGYDGSTAQYGGGVFGYVDGTPSSGNVPTRISFVTGNNSSDRTERLTIKSTGNVGIGTTSPDGKLTIQPSAGGTGERIISFFNDAGLRRGSLLYDVANIRFRFVDRSDNVILGWDEQTRNVGIGTTSPQGLLHTAIGNSNNNYSYFDTYDDGVGESYLVLRKSDSDTVGTIAETDDGDNLGYLMFQGVDSGGAFDNGAYILATQNGASGTKVPANLSFYTSTNSASLERMRIDKDGNVGIATTTPSYKLDVVGTSQFSQPVIVGTPTANSHATTKSYVDSMFTGSGQWTTNGGVVYLTSTTQRVGIGTTNPGNILEVSSAGLSSGISIKNTNGNDPFIDFYNNSGGRNYINMDVNGGQGGNSSMNFATNELTRMTIDFSNGNVGIGTTSPDARTVVYNTSTTTGGLYVKSAAYSGADVMRIFYGTGSSYYIAFGEVNGSVGIKKDSQFLPIHSNTGVAVGAPKFIVTDSGWSQDIWSNSVSSRFQVYGTSYFSNSVGIATTTPQAPLDVNGIAIVRSDSYVYGDRSSGSLGVGQFHIKGATDPLKEMWFQLDTTNNVGKINTGRSSTGAYNMAIQDYGGNLGIGTSTPNYKLDVVGTSQFSQPVIVGTPTANSHATTKSYVDSMFTGSGQWTTSGGNVYLTSTTQNVGIGITVPHTKLEINGDTDITYHNGFQFNVPTTNQQNRWLRFSQSGTTFSIQGYAYDGAENPTSDSKIVLQPSAGNVGIGTVSPAQKLDVNGNLNIAHGAYLMEGNSAFIDSDYGGTNTYVKIVSRGLLIDNNVGIGTTNPSKKFQVATDGNDNGIIVTNAVGTTTIALYTENANAGRFFMFENGSARIHFSARTGHNQYINNGNLGIATTTPSYKLDVVGTSQFSQPVIVGTPTANTHATTKSYVDSIVGGGAGSGSFSTLSVSGTSTLAVSSSNVGIGTATPTEKLNIYGNGAQLRFDGGNNRILFGTRRALEGNSDGTLLQLGEQYTTTSLYGNVGIGTSGPGYKLDVLQGSGEYQTIRVGNVATDNTLKKGGIVGRHYSNTEAVIDMIGFYSDNNNHSVMIGSNSGNSPQYIKFFTSSDGISGGSERMRVHSDGNVGIGTSGPNTKLHIENNGALGLTIKNSSASGGDLDINLTQSYVGASSFLIRNDVNGGLRIRDVTNTSDRMRIGTSGDIGIGGAITDTSMTGASIVMKSGNVGIATTTPSYKLDVVGTSQFSQPVIVGTPTANSHATTKSYVDSMFTGSGQWTTNGGNVYLTSTTQNVGIKTTDPYYSLQIGSGGIKFGAGSDGAGSIVPSGGTNLYIKGFTSDDTGGIHLSASGGSTRMFVRNDGYVGVGTTSPGNKFEVVGGNIALYESANTERKILVYRSGVIVGGLTSANGAMTLESGNSKDIYITPSSPGNVLINSGNVGIATTTPAYNLDVAGYGRFTQPVLVGTPTASGHAATKSYVDSIVGGGAGSGSFTTLTVTGTSTLSGNLWLTGAMYSNLNMNGKNITGINKLTVSTIDPLYEIEGKKYSTYASAIVGGVKEEYVGRGKLTAKSQITNNKCQTNIKNQNSNDQNSLDFDACNLEFGATEYQYVIDFNNIKRGSDLWVWYKAIDFSKENVEVLVTPIKTPVSIAYEIEGNKIVFKTNNQQPTTNNEIEFSYRLVGKRFDWKEWPTYAKDQSEAPSLIVR